MTEATFTLLGVGTSSGVPRLGCSCEICKNCLPGSKNRRQRVAALLEVDGKKLLIDAGPDIRNQLLEHNVHHIDALLVTHNHFDHIAGLDDVKYVGNLKDCSIPLYCNPPTGNDLQKRIPWLLKSTTPAFHPPFEICTIKPWSKIPFGPLTIQTLCYTQQNEGHSHPTEVMGFRVGTLAFLTDIKRYQPRLLDQLEGVEILIVGAVRDGESVAHFTFQQAAEFAKLIQAKRTIFIHLDHSVDYATSLKRLAASGPLDDFGIELGYDGLKIERFVF